VLFVERRSSPSRLAVLHEVERALGDGARVLNFPEGTTSDGATVLRFRKGMFGAAQRAGVPVVPVALAYAPRSLAWVGDATFVPHYLRLAALARPAVTVAFGEPLSSRSYATAEALAEAARDRIVALRDDRPERLERRTTQDGPAR
jgi:lyso-ornithine lipid O-acyltransferase